MGLDATLKRYSPVIIALMVALCAYFQAVGMGQLLATTALEGGASAPRGVHLAHRGAPEADRDHATSATAILERNPFDSVTGPLDGKTLDLPRPADSAEPTDRDPYADPPCPGARALLIASSADPDWSFAAIVGADGKSALRRRGEEVDGQKVVFVGDLRAEEQRHLDESGMWDRVWLASASGARCQLALGAKAAPAKAPGPVQPQGAAPDKKVRQIGERQFEIDRTTLEATLANPAELMKTRILPVRDGDRVVGMKLLGIKPGTLLGSLGMENGDVLTSINGFEMNDPQKMLEAYSKLTHADALSATVTRGGKPVNLELKIK
jgi:general secretion pathway protein C